MTKGIANVKLKQSKLSVPSTSKVVLGLPRKITFLRPWLWSTHSGMQMLELHCVYGVITTQMPDGHTDTHRDASRTKKGPPITCSVMCYYFCYTMSSKLFRNCTDFFMQTISRKSFLWFSISFRIQPLLKYSVKFDLLSFFYRKFVNGQYL